ncbi:MAG TPA: hypothetical protein VFF49_01115 [Thermodesulfobacteriota bacterium]|nr:hypothetical protein [Thermodesulfobacteriota bacterium]
MNDTIIEVRGGVVVEIYSENPSSRFIVIDWDNYEADENDCSTTPIYQTASFSSMSKDTTNKYEKIVKKTG